MNLMEILSSTTVHKVASAVGAALSGTMGPGINSNAHLAASAGLAFYAAVLHLVDSLFNSPKGTSPTP